MTDTALVRSVTYRSRASSTAAGYVAFCLGFIVTVAASAPFTSRAPVVALGISVPFALWEAFHISVILHDDGAVTVRNLARTRRIPVVAFAVSLPTGPYAAQQINFIDPNGRAVRASAMTRWSARKEPAERMAGILAEWAQRCLDLHGVTVSLVHDELRRATSRKDRIRRGMEMETADPVESLRSVRRANIDGKMISIRPSGNEFRVYIETMDIAETVESAAFPTLDAAIAEGIRQVECRTRPSA